MIDEQIMLEIASGEIGKAAILYERYKKPILKYFIHKGTRQEIAEDLMQQVFFRIIHYRESYKEAYPFKPWIFKIARNVFLKEVSNKNLSFVSLDKAEDLSTSENVWEDNSLHKALKLLPEEYREVIMLSRFEELKYDEIAEMLDISVSLVKVRVFRGLKILREIYFQQE